MAFRALAACFPIALLSCAAPSSAPPQAAANAGATETTATPAPPASTTPSTIPRPGRPRVAVEADPATPQPIAKLCHSPSRTGNSARGTHVTLRVSSDGGWCRQNLILLYEETEPGPYTGMDVIEQPAYGTVQIHNLTTETAFYYRAEPGYSGRDRMVLQAQPTFGRIVVSIRIVP
jgi:hypothetical protein